MVGKRSGAMQIKVESDEKTSNKPIPYLNVKSTYGNNSHNVNGQQLDDIHIRSGFRIKPFSEPILYNEMGETLIRCTLKS